MTNPSNSRIPAAPAAAERPRGYRVLMIAPTSFFAAYGCHVRILEETRILTQLGQHVTIATYHNGSAVPGLDIRRSLPIPWRRDYEVGSSRHKIAFDIVLGLKVLELLARQRFDLIHAHLHEGALMGLVLGRLARVPMVFDFQGSLTGEMFDHNFLGRSGVAYSALHSLETWLDRAAPIVFTSSTQAERLLEVEFGCLPEHVRVLPDCVNAEVFQPAAHYDPARLSALRQSLGIPSDRKLIVYLGLLAEYQGTGLLLEAMQQIVSRRRDVHLLLMGFPNVNSYRSKAEALGVSDFVTFTGRLPYEQAPVYLALGDAAIAPKLSLTEGAGKLLNYMSVGLPTVAFDTPVARQYLGPSGIFADRGNVASLVEQLIFSLFAADDAPDSPRQRGRRLRRRACQYFGWDSAGDEIVKAYRELLGDAPAQAIKQPRWATSPDSD